MGPILLGAAKPLSEAEWQACAALLHDRMTEAVDQLKLIEPIFLERAGIRAARQADRLIRAFFHRIDALAAAKGSKCG